ncbi:DUF1580 domain-containing protein [Humisphaera borealis]
MKGRGRRLSCATLYRWINNGLRGVKLETVLIGGSRCTSVEACERFIGATQGGSPAPAACRTASQRTKAVDAAKRQLDAFGI